MKRKYLTLQINICKWPEDVLYDSTSGGTFDDGDNIEQWSLIDGGNAI